jgi:hypothetical protein
MEFHLFHGEQCSRSLAILMKVQGKPLLSTGIPGTRTRAPARMDYRKPAAYDHRCRGIRSRHTLSSTRRIMTLRLAQRMTARVFAPAVAEREAQMRAGAAIGTKLINLRPINASPALFSWSDLSQDPNDWRNKCFARYYQVGAVRVSKP